jgi:gliding motility-associated-like protein
LWNTGDTTRNLFVAEAGNYFVTGFSQRECPYLSAGFEVKSIPCNYSIPNLFTPNEDGENDTWRTKEPFLASVSLKVYNRWGKEVYSSEDPAFSWDAKNASSGSYFYHLSGFTVEGENFSASGWVTMVK